MINETNTNMKVKDLNKEITKAKIEVFESPLSSKVIATFKTIEDLIKWNKKHNVFADRVSVNNCILYGWDELYDFV